MKHIRFVIFALAAVLTASCCNKEVKPSDKPRGSLRRMAHPRGFTPNKPSAPAERCRTAAHREWCRRKGNAARRPRTRSRVVRGRRRPVEGTGQRRRERGQPSRTTGGNPRDTRRPPHHPPNANHAAADEIPEGRQTEARGNEGRGHAHHDPLHTKGPRPGKGARGGAAARPPGNRTATKRQPQNKPRGGAGRPTA